MKNFYQSANEGMKQLKKEKPELTEIADFYQSILSLQEKTYELFTPPLDHLSGEQGERRIMEGHPLLKKEDILFNDKLFTQLITHIIHLIKKKNGLPKDVDLKSIRSSPGSLLKGLLEDSSILEKSAREIQVENELFYFVINTVFSPFIAKYGRMILDDIKFDKWLKGSCPLCGGSPFISILEGDEGKKMLICSRCYTKWPFKRLGCSFCQNEDQESLRYFFDEYNDAYRVDVCDTCKGYLKVIDLRKAGREVNVFAEHISTLELDMVAEKEGFRGMLHIIL